MVGKKEKKIAVFLVDQGGTLEEYGRKVFKITSKRTLSYKGRTFLLKYDNTGYRKGLKTFFFFNFNSTSQITIDEKKAIDGTMQMNEGEEIDPSAIELMDIICNSNTITQILKASETKKKLSDILTYIAMGLLGGTMLGYILAQFVTFQ